MRKTIEIQNIESLIEDLAKALVDRPEGVHLKSTRGRHLTILELSVSPGDYGKLIGKKGRTVQAMRRLLLGMTGRQNRRFELEIIDPEQRSQISSFSSAAIQHSDLHLPPSHKSNATEKLLARMLKALVDQPESIELKKHSGYRAIVFEIRCAQEDLPKLIGRRGDTATALREVLFNLGAKEGCRYCLEIIEED